jgi:PKHD-type hydroxylase
MENDLFVREGLISKESCELFIAELFNKDTAINGAIKKPQQNALDKSRNTKVCWINANAPIGLLLFNQMLIANQKANWWFDLEHIEDVQIGEYSIDGHYDWHIDEALCSRDGTSTQRKVSISLFLSDPNTYEGGELIFEDQSLVMPKTQGTIVIFPSCVRHSIKPITSGVRYSAVAWARGPYFR